LLSLTNLKIVVIDPHGDYIPFARLIGARVYEVPRYIPPLRSLENSRYLHMLLMEFGLAHPGTDGAAVEAVKAMAKAAGVEEEPEEAHVRCGTRRVGSQSR
jgi:hypothetical protein